MAKTGIGLKITTSPDLSKVAAAIKPIQAKTVDNRMDALTGIVHRNIQNEAPKKTGNLRQAIVKVKRGPMKYEIIVDGRRKGGKYEHFVRLGTRRHVITPKKKQALFWPGASHPVKRVNHPGTKANNYWQRGLDRSEREFDAAEKLLADEIERESFPR